MDHHQQLLDVLQRYWGYDEFRPLQAEAMTCAMENRDSLTVLPTGGGKSLCFQAPAMCREGLTLVVSPLISLMKDQVDALRNCGIAADYANSSQSAQERYEVAKRVKAGETKLLYLSPERLVTDATLALLQQIPLELIAVDEAHCISAWGHDFRPEYRRIGELKQLLPNTAIHAYTATANERVRNDIVEQLSLENATVLVGSFDRPNLHYRVLRRANRIEQIYKVVSRHEEDSGIVYCISRDDTEKIALGLRNRGVRAQAYHAGLTDEQRQRIQDDFQHDRTPTIVATIAFGMGIDKSNVRYVIHAGMPKSLENYQQEMGRAGRDGLPSECVLLFSGRDFHVWKQMLEQNEGFDVALDSLTNMYQFCSGMRCRHQALVEYFGQSLDEPCGSSCDVCDGEIETVDDAKVIAQKLISCVARTGQRFGADYVSLVLNGSQDQKVVERGHETLTTYGLLKEQDRRTIRDWLEQLVDQGFLEKSGEYNIVSITKPGHQVLRGEATPLLLRPKISRGKRGKKSDGYEATWEGVDQGLFDALRELRKQQAFEQHVPAYVVFGDQTLRELARIRPSNMTTMLLIRGIGEHKLSQYGEIFVAAINGYCRQHELTQDVGS